MDSADVTEEGWRDFDAAVERLRSDLRLLAESVAAGRAEMAAFREEVRTEFEELKAVIRQSVPLSS